MSINIVAPTFESDPDTRSRELDLFITNISLILDNAQHILNVSEYFFCPLSFASCSLLYIGGGGWLRLGHLLLGWGRGILLEPCPDCGGNVLVFSFSGSILSGGNSWCGLCTTCRTTKVSSMSWHKSFSDRAHFGADVRSSYPYELISYEKYDAFNFSWEGDGLSPVRKPKPVKEPVCEAISLETLCNELQNGNLRRVNPPVPRSGGFSLELDFLTADGIRIQSKHGKNS